MPKNSAEKLAIEAHATYLIIKSDLKKERERSELKKKKWQGIHNSAINFLTLEKAANRLYRRYHFAFGN